MCREIHDECAVLDIIIFNIIVNICSDDKFWYYKRMISKEEVEHIAKLARLELSGAEVKKMQKDLTEILGYFDLLKNVPEIKMVSTQALRTNARKDEILPRSTGLAERLIVGAPDKKDGYIKVKTIL